MHRPEQFLIEHATYDSLNGQIELTYAILEEGQRFIETYTLPPSLQGEGQSKSLEKILQTLHVLAGISYYKTSLPVTIDVQHPLSAADAAFFTEVYEKGLGEFFFQNKIDWKGVVHFTGEPEDNEADATAPRTPKRVLVPFGGGKDSIVTAMLLKNAGFDVTLFRVGGNALITRLATALGLPLLTVGRRLDPLLFSLNAKGALNGHVPITGILSALSVFIAELGNFDAVLFSNERSSDEGNVTLNELEVNHQWSKSIAFERAFRAHLTRTVGTDVEFASLLRPWSELQIMQECVKYPAIFSLFTSCNRNWKQDEWKDEGLWCRHCPKCAFTGLLLAAFLPRRTVNEIQQGDVLADPTLVPLYEELLGLSGHKPFECVGTPDEAIAAFHLVHERGEYEDSPAMKAFLASPLAKNGPAAVTAALTSSDTHCLSPALLAALPQ